VNRTTKRQPSSRSRPRPSGRRFDPGPAAAGHPPRLRQLLAPRGRAGARAAPSRSTPHAATCRPPRPDEQGARPDARRPELATAGCIRNQQLTIGSLQQEAGVATREEPRGGGGTHGGAERRLVAGDDPSVADRPFAPASGCYRAPRTRIRLLARRSPPTGLRPSVWWGRRRAGTGARAPGGPRRRPSGVAARSRRPVLGPLPSG
jgi:hypothetical protein